MIPYCMMFLDKMKRHSVEQMCSKGKNESNYNFVEWYFKQR